MLALVRQSAVVLVAAVLLAPLSQARPAEGEDDCVHLVGYGGPTPARNPLRSQTLGGKMTAGICSVDNSRVNRGTPIKTNADFVPITGDDGLGFYCVYGVRASATGGVGGNVCIYIIELTGGEVLLYGSGYGNIPGANLFDAAYDMERVDQVIRYCMGKDPAQTPLRILVPHGHGDHVNPACNRELERLGYRILEIAFHPADLPLVNGMSWTSADRALFRMMPAGTTCLQELSSYSSPLGKLWTFHRPGHTAGSIDLVLDIRNDPTNRMVIRGSQPSAPCAPVPGQREVIDAHGNVELVSTPPSLLDVTPLTGTSLGGTALTLTGLSFLAAGAGQHRVLIDGRDASNVVVLNDTTLTCTSPAGPPGQLVVVGVVNNNGKALYAGTFFYNALPTLTSILPASGDLHGGTTIQVRGSGFLGGGTTEVRFGTVLGTGLSIKSDSLLTVRTPAGTPGATVALSLSNANGLATLPAAFRYDTNLSITALQPANGTSLGGTAVIVTGTSFTGTGETPGVTFDGLPATSVTVLSDTSLSCVAPSGVAGTTVSVVVTNSAGSASFIGYRYNALPRITALTPGTGRASGGTLITLTGSGFQVDTPGLNQVRFGGIRATQLSIKSDGSLTCLAPAGAAGTTVNVTVSNLNGIATLPLAYTYALPLAVNTLTPSTGTSLGGTSVTIAGSGFLNGPAGATSVRFGGVLASAVNVLDDGTLSCNTPAGTPLALVDVQVSNANGTVTAPAAFRYNPVPTLTSVSPNHGHAGTFTPATVTGSGFLDNDAGAPFVVAGGVAASSVEVLSDTTLTCALPPGTPGATVDLILVNQNGTSTLVGAFRYHTAPTLLSASPAGGAATSQLRVTLSGSGFVNDQAGTPTITFGGIPATSVAIVGDQAVRCNAPVGTPGTSVDVVLTNARGTATLVGGYRYYARPRVTAVTPNKGTFQGGTALTLSGGGFQVDTPGPNVVTIGGALASNVVVLNDGTLTCTSPPGIVNAVVDVVVSNANGSGTLTGGFSYSVPAPSLVALTPPSGKASAPGIVQVTGTGFQANAPGTNVVRFGGLAASAVTVLDDSTLTCQAPPGTPGARVDVELSNINGSARLALGFRYHPLPTLTALTPAAGSALGGTIVQLTGSGFQSDTPGTNLVSFGATPATGVIVVNDTTLTCVAPAGTPGGVQQVTLSNANGQTSALGFAYHPLPTLASLAPDIGPTSGDTLVTLVGTGFLANAAGANQVIFGGLAAKSVTVVSDTTLTCRTPIHAQGYVDVVVANTNGSATLVGAYHFGKRPPTLSSLEPASGSSLGQGLVTLRGRGFMASRAGVNRVKFGDVLSDNVITVDDETLFCSAAPGVPGSTVDVAVNNNLGSASLPQSYRYHPLPTLLSISPAKGPPLGTGTLTLTGTGFVNNSAGETWVRFGTFLAQDVVVLSDTRLTCRVVATIGKHDVSVSNSNGTAVLPGAFEIGAPPTLTSLSPAEGPFTGGTSVLLTGKGFSEGRALVSFGGVLARDVVVLSDTSLRCTTPPGAIGRRVSVNVRTNLGGALLFNAFTYRAIQPDLTLVTPDHGPAAGGTRVTLNGSGFLAQGAGALRVSFGGVPATNVSVLGDASAACDVPAGSAGALVDVLVENANGSDTLAGAFRYNPPPSLTSLAPTSGAATGGLRVTLQGQGFLVEGAGSNLVLFGGVAALDVLELSDTTLECTTPAGTPGARVDVRLLNLNGEATLAAAFQYRAPPLVSALTPDHGPASGALVTLTGTGFQASGAGTNTVTFGALAATQVAVVNDTTLTCRAPAGTAGTRVDVTVSNANGSGSKTSAFRYHALPTLTTLTPSRGPATGGTVVSLSGTGFQSDTPGPNTVLFGSTPATNVVVVNDTTLTCTTPGGTPAALVDVSLQNANGTAVRTGGFRYNALPSLVALTPTSGSEFGGTSVTLSGSGFVANEAGQNSVFFGNTPASSVVAVNDGSVTCVAPPGTPGSTVDVRLANANGSSTLSGAYRYNRAPSLTSLTPTSGKAQGGTSVTLNGAGFTAVGAGTTVVSFGGVAATGVVVLDDARVQCLTPAGTGGAVVDVVLSNQNGSATLNAAYRRHALPTLTSVAPSRGSSNASSVVTLTGTGFLADGAGTNTVLFGTVPASGVSVLSDTSLVCTAAAQPAGTQVDVSLSNANGSVVLAAAFRFDAPAPTLTAVAPPSGLAAGGTSVTLTGTGFLAFSAGTNTVTFGGVAATGVVVVSDTTLQCLTPAGTAGASVDVRVSNVNGSALRAAAFTYLAAGPTLSAISPASGPAAGGGTVTLTGSGFQASGAGTNTVTFGGAAASNVSVLSDTSLTCTVPAGTGGSSATVVLGNANGSASLVAGYRYHGLPTISSISPPDGTSLGGTLVTVRGTGFVNDAAGVPQISFGGTPGGSVVVFDDGRVTCRVPSGTSGAVVPLTLTNANGTAQSPSDFRYHSRPTLTSITAASGPAAGGNRVTLAGSGFLADGASVNIVSFGGISATGVSVLGDATIQCNVPAGTAGLAVQVTVANVNGTALLPSGYRYYARPTLTAVAPANGPPDGGTSVTLTGSGFQLDAPGPNALSFGGVAATAVVVQSDTQLTCVTPAGPPSTAVDVVLTNANGSVTLFGGFTYDAVIVPIVTGVTPARGPTLATTAVRLSGAGFLPGMSVSFGSTPATSVVVVDRNTIDCQAPPLASSAWVDVSVSWPQGNARLPLGFQYFVKPALLRLEPSMGEPVGGSMVVVVGSGFLEEGAGTHQVTIGGVPATNVVVYDDQHLSCEVPPGPALTDADVQLTNGNGVALLARGFRWQRRLATDLDSDGRGDLLLGSPGDDTIGRDAGAVNVFFSTALPILDKTSAQADLKALPARVATSFSVSVAAGDLDGDGHSELLIGAPGDDLRASNAGTVYVFGGPLSPSPVPLIPSQARTELFSSRINDRFGAALCLRDLDRDGVLDLMVGVPGRTPGAVHVFKGGAAGLGPQANLVIFGEFGNEGFATSLAAGDLDGDGWPEFVVGAPTAFGPNSGTPWKPGEVRIFRGGPGAFAALDPQPWVVLHGAEDGEGFGTSIAVRDLTGDGIDELIVGAPASTRSGTASGAVYVFLGSPTLASGSAFLAKAVFDAEDAGARLGTALATGDVDGDGRVDLLIGAPNQSGSGRAYLFRGGAALADRLAATADVVLMAEVGSTGEFGNQVALVDVDGNGRDDMVVTAPGLDNFGTDLGRVYVFGAANLGASLPAENADGRVTGSGAGDQLGRALGSDQ